MSLGVCIPDLIARGKISQQHADELQSLYDDLVRQYERRMGRDAAEAAATEDALKAWERRLKDGRRTDLLQVKRQAVILNDARTGFRGAKADGPVSGKAMEGVLAWERRANYSNVEYREKAVRGEALGMMYDILAHHRADLLGRIRHKSDLTDMVAELFGKDTGNLNARELADAWRQTAEMLRQRFNAAGGAIGKLEDWGLPQSHDPLRVGAVDAEQWIATVMPMLDRSRMLDRATALPLGDAELRTMLRDVYENIVSDGWVGRQPGQAGRRALANRRAETRVLHFTDADGWMAYNDRFGHGTPWQAMMHHVHGMSRDIAMMEILGPNPTATIRWMKDVMVQDAAVRGTLADRKAAARSAHQIDKLWSVLTGESNRPVNETLALGAAALRQWESASKLGGAVLASFSDAATTSLTRHFNGLDATSTLSDLVRQLNPVNPEARAVVRRAGFISDELIGHVSGAGRIQLDELTGGRLAGGESRGYRAAAKSAEFTRRLSDGVLRASGLGAWTMGMREATAREFAATFAEQAGKAWSALDPKFRGFFERYGIGERGWDAIRATEADSSAGYPAIWPAMVADKAIGTRLQEAILTETDFSVPTGGLRQRALIAGYRPGTWMGELVRTAFQFKMFPVTVMAMHTMRMLDQPGAWNKVKYGIGFLAATTVMGAVSYQMAELEKGEDPAMMLGNPLKTFAADKKPGDDFWWRAILKGGGLGVFGDLINNSTNQYGQKLGDLVIGPGWSTAQNVANLVWGHVETDAGGSKYRVHDLARFLQRESPLGSLWYTRLAWERLVVDQLGELQDPNFAQSYDRMARRAQQDGTAYYAPRGTGPSQWRAPDFRNAVQGHGSEMIDDSMLQQ